MLFRKSTKTPRPTAPPESGPVSSDEIADVQATITEMTPCQKSVRLQMRGRAIDPIRATVLSEFQRQAALPGFRKGKAPAGLVAQQYAKAIQDETLQRATQQALERATQEHGLKPVGPF